MQRFSHVMSIMDSWYSVVSHGLKAGEEKEAGDVCGAGQGGQLNRLIRASSDLPSGSDCPNALTSTRCSRGEE